MIAIKMAGIGAPVAVPGTKKVKRMNIGYVLAPFMIMLMALVSCVSAANETIDFSSVGTLISGVATDIIPAMGSLVIAIVPVVMLLAVVSFVVLFFDKILSMFDKVFSSRK
jgi:hypothetical protein